MDAFLLASALFVDSCVLALTFYPSLPQVSPFPPGGLIIALLFFDPRLVSTASSLVLPSLLSHSLAPIAPSTFARYSPLFRLFHFLPFFPDVSPVFVYPAWRCSFLLCSPDSVRGVKLSLNDLQPLDDLVLV